MNATLRRVLIAAIAFTYVAIPLYPSFIVLEPVGFPGIALLPRAYAIGILAAGALAECVFAIAFIVQRRRGANPLLVPLIALFVAGLLAALTGFDPSAGLLFAAIFGMGVLWHSTLLCFYDEPGVARAIYWSYLVSGGLAAAAAVAMVVLREPAAQYAIQHGRATGTFVLPGELAAYLIVLIPVAYALARIARERALRFTAWAVLAIALPALAMTYSRAGWTGFAVAAAFLIAAQFRAVRQRATAVGIVVGCAAVAVLLLFNVHHNPSEDYTRISIWQAALQIIDRFPLTGVGPFDFSRLYTIVRVPDGEPSAYHAHSIYLTIFAEMGLIGIAAFGWVCWRFALEIRARVASAQPDAALLAMALTAGLVGVAVQGLIDTMSVVIFGLWLPTMALALGAARHGLGEPAR
ncbi:MAG TPA: O-antigen ligase family protein [Candidatus Acidoferrales bacterium]|nr:O-antigen ligase family protein [Candidatus Acidoferrales bacterium]